MSKRPQTPNQSFEKLDLSGGQNVVGGSYRAKRINIVHNAGSPHQQDSNDAWIQRLRCTDPQVDRQDIQLRKDQLIVDCCDWIYHDEAFEAWWAAEQGAANAALFWLHGGPGKGKTMLMMALADEIKRRLGRRPASTTDAAPLIVYHFCQATNGATNTANAVLRGLLYFIVNERPSLLRHVKHRLSLDEDDVLDGLNGITLLWTILEDVAADNSLGTLYLLVDALDECRYALKELLTLISQSQASRGGRIKWLISSRNEADISRVLPSSQGLHLSLEVNEHRVLEAIKRYIQRQTETFAAVWTQDQVDFVQGYLLDNAQGTFLWVWLVCHELQNLMEWDDPRDALHQFPSELHQVYGRMARKIIDAKAADYCKALLQAVQVSRYPLTLEQARFAAGLPLERFTRLDAVEQLAKHCGSFLLVKDERINLVHKSALDYLLSEDACTVFSSSSATAHAMVAQRCFDAMLSGLRPNPCRLTHPGRVTRNTELDKQIRLFVSVKLHYASTQGVFHLNQSIKGASSRASEAALARFSRLLTERFNCWAEMIGLLQLCRSIIQDLWELQGALSGSSTAVYNTDLTPIPSQKYQTPEDTLAWTIDAQRFLVEWDQILEEAPLQAYSSTTLFSPRHSLIKRQYAQRSNITDQIDSWSPLLHTLTCRNEYISAMCLSTVDDTLVSGSNAGTLCIWNAVTGQLILSFQGHTRSVSYVVLSDDAELMASCSGDCTVRLWEVSSGSMLHTLTGHTSEIFGLIISSDKTFAVSASWDGTIRIWDVQRGTTLNTIAIPTGNIRSMALSANDKLLALGFRDGIMQVWDVSTGLSPFTRNFHTNPIGVLVVFSKDTKLLACTSDLSVEILNPATGAFLFSLNGHTSEITTLCFSYDSQLLASGSLDGTLCLWDLSNKLLLCTLEGHSGMAQSVVFSHDDRLIASGSWDTTIRVWNVSNKALLYVIDRHFSPVHLVAFSHNNRYIASVSNDSTVRIWDATGTHVWSHPQSVDCTESRWVVAISNNGKFLASLLGITSFRVWNVRGGLLLFELNEPTSTLCSPRFSPNEQLLAMSSKSNTIRLWNTSTGELLLSLRGHPGMISSISFSPNGQLLAAGSREGTVRIWDIQQGILVNSLECHSDDVLSVQFFSNITFLSVSKDANLRLWNAAEGSLIHELDVYGNSMDVVAVSLSKDLMAYRSGERTVDIWNATTGKSTHTLGDYDDPVSSMAFSNDGELLASSTWRGTLKLWNTSTGLLRWTWNLGELLHHVIFSHDDRIVAAADGTTVLIWNSITGELQARLEGHSGWTTFLSASRNGILASGSQDSFVRTWDFATGTPLSVLEPSPTRINSVSFSSDGQLVASASRDRKLQIWRTEDWHLLHSLVGHYGPINTVAFSHNGEILASGSSDRRIRLWHLSSGTLRSTLTGHGSAIMSLLFSPDGTTLASGSCDETVRKWDLSSGTEMERVDDQWCPTSADLQKATGWLPGPSLAPVSRLAVSADKEWITRDGKDHLWLPEDRRPTAWACFGKYCILGTLTGSVNRIWLEDD